MKPSNFLGRLMKWVKGTAAGHVTWSIAFGASPMILFFLAEPYRNGTLTLSWALKQIAFNVAIWGLNGLLVWHFVTRPRRSKRESLEKPAESVKGVEPSGIDGAGRERRN